MPPALVSTDPCTLSPPSTASSLSQWLSYLETLHPQAIALGLERVKEVAQHIALKLACPVITVGGTNGKGSTCALLESILLQAGYRVGLYTSPHIHVFNERARIQGVNVSDDLLIKHFEIVEQARKHIALTYFEFSTLAILHLFSQHNLDAVILEVGLGGRLDAVNIVDADCSIVTSIDIDHADWLGDTREKIAYEKAHIYRPGRPAICSDPLPPASLLSYADSIGADLWLIGRDFNYSGDQQQWQFAARGKRRYALAYPALRGTNQLLNASAALAALQSLSERLPVSQQAVRQGLAVVDLPGRFQVLAGRPVTILDVAHNPHAAAVLAQNLGSMGFFPYTYAVIGMLQDKDIVGVVSALKDKVDHWYCATLPGPRGATAQTVQAALLQQGVLQDSEKSIQVYSNVDQAFAAARDNAGENDRIVVFGSFLTVAAITV